MPRVGDRKDVLDVRAVELLARLHARVERERAARLGAAVGREVRVLRFAGEARAGAVEVATEREPVLAAGELAVAGVLRRDAGAILVDSGEVVHGASRARARCAVVVHVAVEDTR